jgi:hypothetical protein
VSHKNTVKESKPVASPRLILACCLLNSGLLLANETLEMAGYFIAQRDFKEES